MSTSFRAKSVGLSLLCAAYLLLAIAPADGAHLVEQSFQLQPGWNAVFLEVQPPDNSTLEVFRNVPIASAWGWRSRGLSAEFVKNLSEDMYRDPQWLCFFPTNRPERMFNNLFQLTANQPYLIKLEGTNIINWVVSGRPAVKTFAPLPWLPNEFNLVGFPLRTDMALPGLNTFFAPEPAFLNQPTYVLNSAGRWELVTNGSLPVEAGKCFWVFAQNSSTYLGPLSVTVEQGDGLDYGETVTERKVFIKNVASTPAVVSVRDLNGPGPLTYWTFNTTLAQVEWLPIPDPLTMSLAPNETYTLRLAVNRNDFVDNQYFTTIQVESDSGTRVRIPLSAQLP
ncbi:MAG TPA: hypothetical protein PJ991_07110 [Kiritimatiellia bacterium]|nr:hypothetical protein [Kiritimatiellia bacterium]